MPEHLRISIIHTDPQSRLMTLEEDRIELPPWARWTMAPAARIDGVPSSASTRTPDDCDAEIEIRPAEGP